MLSLYLVTFDILYFQPVRVNYLHLPIDILIYYTYLCLSSLDHLLIKQLRQQQYKNGLNYETDHFIICIALLFYSLCNGCLS